MASRRRATPQQPAAFTCPTEKRPWLLMLHLSASAPNLEDPLDLDLEELKDGLSSGASTAGPFVEPEQRVYVVVQIDGPGGLFRRYWIKKDGHVFVTSGESTPGSLRTFVTETAHCFPADRRVLVLWGHSAGVAHNLEVPLGVYGDLRHHSIASAVGALPGVGKATAARGRSFFELIASFLQPASSVGGIWQDLKGLKDAVNIIGFDSCFMASIEIAHELHEVADFVLAPQAAIGLKGWHYNLLLEHILHNPKVVTKDAKGNPNVKEDALTLGRAVVAQVGLSRSSPETLSLIDLARTTDLVKPMSALVERLRQLLHSSQEETQMRRLIFDAFDQALWAGARQFLDLADLCRLLASRVPDQQTRDLAASLLELLAGTERVRTTPRPAHRVVVDQLSMLDAPLGGISIFCPWPRATVRETRCGVRNAEISILPYILLDFVFKTRWFLLFVHPDNYFAAERHWIRREIQDGASELAMAVAQGRVNDPKPAGRVDDPKPAGRVNDPKPAGRGDDDSRSHSKY